jgi:hypothetical protein
MGSTATVNDVGTNLSSEENTQQTSTESRIESPSIDDSDSSSRTSDNLIESSGHGSCGSDNDNHRDTTLEQGCNDIETKDVAKMNRLARKVDHLNHTIDAITLEISDIDFDEHSEVVGLLKSLDDKGVEIHKFRDFCKSNLPETLPIPKISEETNKMLVIGSTSQVPVISSQIFGLLESRDSKARIQSIILKRNSNNGFGISLQQKSLIEGIVVDLPDEGTGLEMGDQILEINGRLTIGMELTEIPKLLENFDEAKIVVLKSDLKTDLSLKSSLKEDVKADIKTRQTYPPISSSTALRSRTVKQNQVPLNSAEIIKNL